MIGPVARPRRRRGRAPRGYHNNAFEGLPVPEDARIYPRDVGADRRLVVTANTVRQVENALQRMGAAQIVGVRFDPTIVFGQDDNGATLGRIANALPAEARFEIVLPGRQQTFPLNAWNRSTMLNTFEYFQSLTREQAVVATPNGSDYRYLYESFRHFPDRCIIIRVAFWDRATFQNIPMADPLQGRDMDEKRRRALTRPIAAIRNRRFGSMYKYYHVFGKKFQWWGDRYQLFDENRVSLDKCLYHAFKVSGTLNLKELEELKVLMPLDHFPRGKLSMICHHFKVNIHLRDVDAVSDNSGHASKKYPQDMSYDRTLRLGRAEEHYFYDEDKSMDITVYALNNYESIKHLPRWNHRVKGNKLDRSQCIKSSYKLFRHLSKPQTRNVALRPLQIDEVVMDSIYRARIKGSGFLTREYRDMCALPLGITENQLEYNKDEAKIPQDLADENATRQQEKDFLSMLFAFDFETCAQEIKSDVPNGFSTTVHTPFCCSIARIPTVVELENGIEVDTEPVCFTGLDCAGQMMKYIFNMYIDDEFREGFYKDGVTMIAHNASFDFPHVIRCFNTCEKPKLMESNCKLKRFEGTWQEGKDKMRVVVKDSWAFISSKLSSFGKMFQLGEDMKKEIMPYDIYNYDNLIDEQGQLKRYMDIKAFTGCIRDRAQRGAIRLRYAIKHKLQGYTNKDLNALIVSDVEQAMQNAFQWGCLAQDEFVDENNAWVGPDKKKYSGLDPIDYAAHYCNQDVRILGQGWLKFRTMVKEDWGVNIDNMVSINQAAHLYLRLQGVYHNVYHLSGVPRAIIQQAVVGGRCMLAYNKKQKGGDAKNPIVDFDEKSQYPGAMSFLGDLESECGYLQGRPKPVPLDCKQYHNNGWDGYFGWIVITKIGKEIPFPVAPGRNKDGTRCYTNAMVGKWYYINRFTLEDLITYQEIEYKVDNKESYYFDQGRNKKITEVMPAMFTKRAILKSQKNPLQIVSKLGMNGAYGRTILKPPEIKVQYAKTEQDCDRILTQHWNRIKRYYDLPKGGPFRRRYDVLKEFSDHYAAPHIGAEILGYAKRSMNRVLCLAHDLGIKIYYTDTDSMHLHKKELTRLSKAFKEKYGWELQGNQLRQFHPDFDWDDLGPKRKDPKTELVSVQSIFVGKKFYLNKLIPETHLESYANDPESCKDVQCYHVRAKGVNELAIYDAALRMNCTLEQVYTDLYNGKAVDFDILAGCNVSFNIGKDFIAIQNLDMRRTVQFHANKESRKRNRTT